MYNYQTRTTTQTATQARRLASRIGAELLQIQAFYGAPSRSDIDEFTREAELYLGAGYLESVRYGFKRNGKVVFELRYTAQDATGINDKPGRIPPGVDISNATWFSYLTHNAAWRGLTASQREDFRKSLPFTRSFGDAPEGAPGLRTTTRKVFSEDTLGLDREVRSL